MNKKIQDTIRKLLALSQSSNENEAQAALLKAQELLAKYHLSLDEVQDQKEIDHTVLEEAADKKAHRTPWKRSLASCIADNFRCDTYYRGNDTYTTLFVGKADDIAVCKEVYTSAVHFIDFYFKAYWKEHSTYTDFWSGREMPRPISDAISEKSSYAYGFISALKERFRNQKASADKEGWGLVLVKDTDVVAYMQAKSASFSKHGLGIGSHSGSDAYSQGKKDGQEKFGDTGLRKVTGGTI